MKLHFRSIQNTGWKEAMEAIPNNVWEEAQRSIVVPIYDRVGFFWGHHTRDHEELNR